VGYMSVTQRTNGNTSAHTMPLRTMRAQTRRPIHTQIITPKHPSKIRTQVTDLAITYGFYIVVLTVALTGATQAMTHQLDWATAPAALACGSVELGGVLFSHHADSRRRVGEAAIPSRIASASVAIGAILVNYFGHAANPFQAYFFAGMSALGYVAYLVKAGAAYRDAMRAAGKMTQPAPAYGLYQTIRHPFITRAARIMAIQNPNLGAIESLDLARNAKRNADRQAAIAEAVRSRIATRVDPGMARIATLTFDMDRIAKELAAGADYVGLTRIISAELTADKVAPVPTVYRQPVELVKPVRAPQLKILTKVSEPAQIEAAPVKTQVEAPVVTVHPNQPRAATDIREQLPEIEKAFPDWRTSMPSVRALSAYLGAKSNTPGVKLRKAMIAISEDSK
jgi:hypothetical protein